MIVKIYETLNLRQLEQLAYLKQKRINNMRLKKSMSDDVDRTFKHLIVITQVIANIKKNK